MTGTSAKNAKMYALGLIMLLISDSAFAAFSESTRLDARRLRGSHRNSRQQRPLPPVNARPLEEAQRKVSNAEAKYRRADAEVARARSIVRAESQSDKRLLTAMNTQRAAQDAHAKSVAAVTRKLDVDPDYQQALQDKEAAKDRLEELRKNGGNSEELSEAAKQATFGSKASKLLANMQRSSPDYSNTYLRLAAANAEVASLSRLLEGSFWTSPKIFAANQARDNARITLKQAQEEKAMAERKFEAALIARAQASTQRNKSATQRSHGSNRRRTYPPIRAR